MTIYITYGYAHYEIPQYVNLCSLFCVEVKESLILYSAYYELLVSKALRYAIARVNEGSHSFTCHQQVY